MTENQKTVRKQVKLSGKGLHTGLEVEMTIFPAPENHGIIFKRVDLVDKPLIHALVDHVTDTSRGTTLVEKNIKISTIEHVMASFAGLGIDNVLVEVNAPEVPILDGSSLYIVAALLKAGIEDQNALKNFYEVKEKIIYSNPKGVEIIIYPDDHFSANVLIDYNSRVLGNQYASINSLLEFEKEIAPSRTFVFLHELEFLAKNNLIKGGDLENAIVIVDREMEQEELDRLADLLNKPHIHVKPNGILNNVDLRFSNEPARHKLLDLMGDMALIGQPIKGKVVASRPGHYANTELGKIVRQFIKKDQAKSKVPFYDPNKLPLMDINQIKKLLPHRQPFLLVDKILEMNEVSIIGLKNVTMNEPFFVGHFPDYPVMPGVLIVEATAQVGGIFALSSVPDPENYMTLFMKLEQVKFKKQVVPGDTLIFKCELISPIKRGIVYMNGKAFVGDSLVMEGTFMAQIAKG
jgi:UDP-3-O-[3-hydroxymyristoyl] N-acetylglucosamine deacetylase/3-hydroxyacyl-[acyl-carrier-protein] dehydratase